MKFIVNSHYLLKQLSSINGVISTNPIVPILENFLFEIDDTVLTATVSDLQTSMVAKIKVESKEKGSVGVPARILMETLKNLPNQPVTFSIDESTYVIEISSENGRYKLSGENAADFPKVPPVPHDFSVTMSSEVLAKAINSTIFATSSDDLRPAMTGVYLNFTEQNASFVATDGHRLICYNRLDIKSDSSNAMIIPNKALHFLRTTLPAEKIDVDIEFSVSNVLFKFDNIKMVSRLIDERFPDYKNVIPDENPIKIWIARTDLLSSMKRISIYANKTTRQVKFKVTGSELQISAEDLDFSNEATERLSCEHEGDDIEIGFNARLFIEMLNNMSVAQIQLSMSAPNKASIILPAEQEEHEDVLMLVMPVMLSQNG